MKFTQLCKEILELVDEHKSFSDLYPLLREIESKRTAEYGERSWPACLVKLEDDEIVVATGHPVLDEYHEARFPSWRELDDEENAELVDHVRQLLRAWLRAVEREAPTVDVGDASGDPWVMVTDGDHFTRSKSMVSRWAQDANMPWFRRPHGSRRGKYEVRRSKLREVIKPQHLEKYGVR